MAAKASAEVATRAAATHRVTVTFRDFWPDFDPRHFFLPLLRGMAPDIDFVVRPRGPVDLEFVSVFPLPDGFWRPLRRGLARRCPPRWRSLVDAPLAPVAPAADARVSIWFTGENRRPPLGGWDLCLSFDGDSTSLANCHLPLWWLLFPELLLPSVPEATAETFLGRGLTLDEVCSARVAERRGRDRFACAFFGNPEPLRLHAVRALSRIAPVDVFGAVGGRRVAAKQDVASRYRFVLCFENTAAPGYVTEKPFDAWGAGAVPLWNGLDVQGFLIDAALVNYAQFPGMDEFCAHVARLDADAAAWAATASQPLLRRRPSLATVRATILDRLVTAGVVPPRPSGAPPQG